VWLKLKAHLGFNHKQFPASRYLPPSRLPPQPLPHRPQGPDLPPSRQFPRAFATLFHSPFSTHPPQIHLPRARPARSFSGPDRRRERPKRNRPLIAITGLARAVARVPRPLPLGLFASACHFLMADPAFERWRKSPQPPILHFRDEDFSSKGAKGIRVYQLPGHMLHLWREWRQLFGAQERQGQ